MNEHKVLAACLRDGAAFQKINAHVEKGDFTDQGLIVYDTVKDWYARDPGANSCDYDIILSRIVERVGNDKHIDQFRQVLEELRTTDVSPPNIVYDFLAVRREALANKLAEALLGGSDGEKQAELLEQYQHYLNATQLDEDNTGVVLRGATLDELCHRYSDENLIRLWPSALNERLSGGVIRGHHIVIFAMPEVGKTLFMVNAVAGFLKQGLTVLYIGNEEPIHDINMRVVSRLGRVTTPEVVAKCAAAQEVVDSPEYNNLILADTARTAGDVRELIDIYSPDVVILDQLRNLRVAGVKDTNKTQQLEKAATEARFIAKDCNVLVVSVTQAGDSARNKTTLDDGDVADSNTGIPAQCDMLFGISKGPDDGEFRRTITMVKNKRNGVHDYFPVRLEPQYSRIVNIGG